MKLKACVSTDVLVMGAGLAGIMAAISAAEAGASVCLMSSAKICSGSSFYPGTWGLGLIGPENPKDEEELEETILKIGEGMANPELVHTFVGGIKHSIDYLEQMGVKLKKAEHKGEREFIPCFDHKNRDWNAILKDSAKEVFTRRLRELSVVCLSDTEVISCVNQEGRVVGAIALKKGQGICYIACKSMVIASGGMGGLFQYRLNTDDIQGMGQYLALMAGASLVNIEFMQMMPGFIHPAPKTIYNEKVFRYSEFSYPGTGESIFRNQDKERVEHLLELRSGHGPFTTRLESMAIDERIFAEFIKDARGVTVTYQEAIWEHQPEFVATYFKWLEKEKHISIRDSVNVGIFAHASNGGIQIDSHGSTGIEGLFACGESTGGMHGADRLGGLSTANGLVFGRIAGQSAAKNARKCKTVVEETEFAPEVIEGASGYLDEIRHMNFESAMINRSEDGTATGEALLNRIGECMKEEVRWVSLPEEIPFALTRDTYRLKAAEALSRCMLEAIRLRKESRGSHYRRDYPNKNKDLEKCVICSGGQDMCVSFQR